jgi:hypothetical protein
MQAPATVDGCAGFWAERTIGVKERRGNRRSGAEIQGQWLKAMICLVVKVS